MKFNEVVAAPLYSDLLSVINNNEFNIYSNIGDYFDLLGKELKLPVRLRDVGIKDSDIAMLATQAMKQVRLLPNNPRTVTYQDAFDLYTSAL